MQKSSSKFKVQCTIFLCQNQKNFKKTPKNCQYLMVFDQFCRILKSYPILTIKQHNKQSNSCSLNTFASKTPSGVKRKKFCPKIPVCDLCRAVRQRIFPDFFEEIWCALSDHIGFFEQNIQGMISLTQNISVQGVSNR